MPLVRKTENQEVSDTVVSSVPILQRLISIAVRYYTTLLSIENINMGFLAEKIVR